MVMEKKTEIELLSKKVRNMLGEDNPKVVLYNP